MKKALVVNCSVDVDRPNARPRVHYNLGTEKLADWLKTQGYDVTLVAGDPGMFVVGYDLVCVGAIFSWHAKLAADIARRALETSAEVWAGGTAFSDKRLRARFVHESGGIVPVYKPDPRFDLQRAPRKYVYAVRGCEGEALPNGSHRACMGCPVPIIEGTRYILDPKFVPAPALLDNNLSGMPRGMQQYIIRRYQESGTRLVDANSGFEPGHFDAETRARWEPILTGAWRWGFDRIEEEANAANMAGLLADVRSRRKRVYTLCGHEPIETCYERAQKVIEWGCEPHVQYMIPLSAWERYNTAEWAPGDQPKCDWTLKLGRAFSRYYLGMFWKSVPIWDFRPGCTLRRRLRS